MIVQDMLHTDLILRIIILFSLNVLLDEIVFYYLWFQKTIQNIKLRTKKLKKKIILSNILYEDTEKC